MKLYVSGPMRGHKQFNFPAFDAAALALTADGHEVLNPAAHDRELYPDIEQWEGFASGDPAKCPAFNLPNSLAWDFAAIAECDGIALLEGWRSSAGACAERFVAEVTGKKIFIFSHAALRYNLDNDTCDRMEFPQLKAGR